VKDKVYEILKTTFGYTSFREKQEDVILNVCYQIPSLIFEGLTVVISPLISLMQDQVDQLKAYDVEAVMLNSSIAEEDYFENIQKIRKGTAKLLYVAPETLLKPNILDLLSSVRVDCFTIDEAHCISEWGHDFRPEYRKLANVRNRFSNAVCIALTATATERVIDDIKKTLSQENQFDLYATSFNRKNLFIEIEDKLDPFNQTINFIKKFSNQSGIIYCFSRKQVDDLYQSLSELGYSVKPYHAGLSESERVKNQKLFIRDDIQIIVATVAFGMGINKPNVRFVLHYDLPKNIESYYQEIGRAGRDGLDSHCLLLFSYSDIQKIRYFINQKSLEEQRVANIHLNSLLGFAETEECRRKPMLNYFGENFEEENCGFCDNCTGEKKDLIDITVEAQKFLSCVKRTGEIYGATYIIDILRGSKNQKIIENHHQELSTYGIGKEYSKKQWQHLSRQFLKKGLVVQNSDFGGFSLTKDAYLCFNGELKIAGTIKEEVLKELKRKSSFSDLDYDKNLFEILRFERKKIADLQNVPPYVIFSDKTLIEISYYYPVSKDEFLKIHGVGNSKFEKYGDVFSLIVKEHIEKNNIVIDKSNFEKPSKTVGKNGKELKYITVGKSYNSGKTVEELIEIFNVKEATILEYLYRYFSEGNEIRKTDFLNLIDIKSDLLAKAIDSFNEHGILQLKPIYESLNKLIKYDDLKILRLHYLTM